MMFGKGKRVSALARFGATQDSTWLRASAGPAMPSHAMESKVHVHVMPDGQPEFESQTRVWGKDVNRIRLGHQTYVLYDPEHPEHCEIDHDRLRKEFGTTYDGKDLVAIPIQGSQDRQAAVMAALAGEGHAGDRAIRHMQAMVGQAAPVSEPPKEDLATSLAKLGELHLNGTLTDAEFAAAKAHLLSS
jgi:hypothetical protein